MLRPKVQRLVVLHVPDHVRSKGAESLVDPSDDGPEDIGLIGEAQGLAEKKKTQKLEDDQSIWADPPDVVHLPEWPIFVRPGEKNALAEKALKLGHPPVIVIPSGDRNSPG